MKKINLLIIFIIILVLLNIGTLGVILYSKNDQAKPFHPPAEPSVFIIKKLELNDVQQKEFEILKRRHRKVAENIREKDKELHEAFFDLLKTNSPDKQKVDSIAGLVAAQQRQLVLEAFGHFAALRNICTDTQKKLFDKNINEIARIVAQGGPQHAPPRQPLR